MTEPAVETTITSPSSDALAEAVSPYTGLTSEQVEALVSAGQRNEAPLTVGDSSWTIIRRNSLSVVNVLLFAISIGLVVLGLYRDAVLTAGIVVLNVGIGIFQELRAKRKLQQIALLYRPTVTVIRDSKPQEISPEEMVSSDVFLIEAGDQLPVDATLLSDHPLQVDESNLTGESELVTKRKGDELYSGSSCMVGSGVCRATLVGEKSSVQRITAQARSYRNIKTPLQRNIDVVIRIMTVVVFVLAIQVILDIESADDLSSDFIPFTRSDVQRDEGVRGLPIVETAKASAVLVALVPQGLILMVAVAYSLAALRLAPRGALVQRVNAVESLSHIDTLCVDKTGTLTTQKLKVREFVPLVHDEETVKDWFGAIVSTSSSRNRTADAIAEACPTTARAPRVEVPFSSARKWSGISLDEQPTGALVMGAPEILMPALSTEDAALAEPAIAEHTAQGLRVLMLGYAEDHQAFDDADGEPNLPRGLRPAGLVSIADELRPEVQETLEAFRDIHIDVKIISGDHPETVLALARQAGFPDDITAISGAELDKLDDERIEEAAEQHTVFGRVTPETKERLVTALENRGHWTAMTGDGVNDILALKRAKVGIAMRSGSEATRSAADLVLMNDSFAALPDAFSEGQRVMRGMADNIKLFLTRTLSLVFLIFFVSLIGQEFPITPSQNSILAMVTVGIPAFALAIWAKPGHSPRGLGRLVVEFVLPAALMVSIISVAVYDFFMTLTDGNVGWSQAAVTTTLVSTLLLIVLFAQPPTQMWTGASSLNGDLRPALLVLLMYLAYIAIVLIPTTREFFELQTLPWSGYVMLAFIVTGWAVIVRHIWRKALGRRVWDFSEEHIERVARRIRR